MMVNGEIVVRNNVLQAALTISAPRKLVSAAVDTLTSAKTLQLTVSCYPHFVPCPYLIDFLVLSVMYVFVYIFSSPLFFLILHCFHCSDCSFFNYKIINSINIKYLVFIGLADSVQCEISSFFFTIHLFYIV